MPKLNLNKKEMAALDVVLKDSNLTMGSISPTNKALIASVKVKLHKVLTPEVKPLKPMSKKAMKKALAEVLPKAKVTNRLEFLNAVRESINARLPQH